MKVLVPVNSSEAALMPIAHLEKAARNGSSVEVLVLNVQPRFNRHISRYTRRADRDAFRLERSRVATAAAIGRLSRAGIPHRALTGTGSPAERIAAVAEAEEVDAILIGVGKHPWWVRWLRPSVARGVIARTGIPVTVMQHGEENPFERYVVPVGIAGLAALLIVTD
jgi:nucleotide-binding universal stress UspA family protein